LTVSNLSAGPCCVGLRVIEAQYSLSRDRIQANAVRSIEPTCTESEPGVSASLLLVASGDFHLERHNLSRGRLLLRLKGNDFGQQSPCVSP
jgi:hypothetical protein